MQINFVDLNKQYNRIKTEIDDVLVVKKFVRLKRNSPIIVMRVTALALIPGQMR